MGMRIMPDAPQPPEPLLRGVSDVAEGMDSSAARATAVCPAPCIRPVREGGKGTGTGKRLVGAHVRQALGPQMKAFQKGLCLLLRRHRSLFHNIARIVSWQPSDGARWTDSRTD